MLMNNIVMAASISNGMAIFKPLYWLFGECMKGLLFIFNEKYFVALCVFTLITRLILFPLNVRQQKTMAKSARIQPKIQKIQKKYANTKDPKDRQKMNDEIQALYAREGHNPMNMGCGPMLFQMIFLMGIIGIIYYPIQYIIGIDISAHSSEIATAINYKSGAYFQMDILQHFPEYKEILTTKFPDLFTADKVTALEDYRASLQLGNVDMCNIPHWKDGIIILIPIFCLLTSMATSVLSTLIQKKNNPAAAQQQSTMLMMMLMMPFFSFYISFKVSAAVGFYWIISNAIALIQQLVMAKFFPPKRSQARDMIDETVVRRAREASIKKMNK